MGSKESKRRPKEMVERDLMGYNDRKEHPKTSKYLKTDVVLGIILIVVILYCIYLYLNS